MRYRGVHLIERNEEVCIFYERVNLQGKAVKFFCDSASTEVRIDGPLFT